MTKIKVAVAGCLGRMGQEITRKIIKDKTGKKPFTNINIARL